jgi:hypothetical protein
MHPFLDVAKLTDEEIIERLGRAYTFMNMQKTLGHSPAVLSIREVIQSLEDERAGRMQKMVDHEYSIKFPEINKPIELGKLED